VTGLRVEVSPFLPRNDVRLWTSSPFSPAEFFLGTVGISSKHSLIPGRRGAFFLIFSPLQLAPCASRTSLMAFSTDVLPSLYHFFLANIPSPLPLPFPLPFDNVLELPVFWRNTAPFPSRVFNDLPSADNFFGRSPGFHQKFFFCSLGLSPLALFGFSSHFIIFSTASLPRVTRPFMSKLFFFSLNPRRSSETSEFLAAVEFLHLLSGEPPPPS